MTPHRVSVYVAVLVLSAVSLSLSATSHATSGAPDQRTYVPPTPRAEIDLNRDWRFQLGSMPQAHAPSFADSSWTRVRVPHTWNAKDGQDGQAGEAGRKPYVRGEGWYRRHVAVPAGLAGKRLFLQFDGANSVADVWVNGHHLGQHRGGYARFRFDATGVLKAAADNVLAVRVSNAHDRDVAPLSGDWTFFGGLYRSVSLVATDPTHVDLLDLAGPGVYLRQHGVSGSSASVTVTTKLANDAGRVRRLQLRTVVADADGRIVEALTSTPAPLAPGARATVERTVRIESPRLWQARQDPYLYTVTTEVRDARTGRVLDAVTQPLGLRSFAISPSSGFHLNGAKLQLRGVNRHQDRKDKGWALTTADHTRDMALIHEMGANALRTAHYQQDPVIYELADQLGMVVYTEVPWVNEMTDSAAFRANVKQQMLELIRQTYNHPSVIFWGIGNELGWLQRDKDVQTNLLLAELAAMVEREDPSRVSGFANMFLRADEDPFTLHAEVSGYNRYEGWYVGSTDLFGVWADALHTRNPHRPIGLTEYGAGANVTQHEEPRHEAKPQHDGDWHPEEYQAFFHEQWLRQINDRPYLWGTFVWNMFDFAADARDEGGQPGINDKGLVTHDRQVKKDAFYWYKANWSREPVTYIASRRWTERTEPATTVKVYSNADAVQLSVNGTDLGSKTRAGDDEGLFSWPVRLQPGDNTVTATSQINGKRYTDTVTWVVKSQ